MLVLVCGLPGTGKTTFAKAIAQELKAIHLNSDMIREEWGTFGQYDEKSKKKLYEELLARTRTQLEAGNRVVVDSTFFSRKLRKPYTKLAKELNKNIIRFLITADEDVIRERVTKNEAFSKADFEVYLKIKRSFEPLEKNHLTLDSVQLSLEDMVGRAQEYLMLFAI